MPVTFKQSEAVLTTLEPLFLQLNHEGSLRNDAILIGVYDLWSTHDHTAGLPCSRYANNEADQKNG